jgi:hypothetical protein
MATLAAAVIGVGGSLYAAKKQSDASDRAIDSTSAAQAQARQDLNPFRKAGAGILGDLVTQAQADPFSLPFERQQGFDAIQNSAAAGGKLQAGGTLKDLTEFNAGITNRFHNDRFRNLFNLATMGQNAAAGQATNTLSGASTMANLMTDKGAAQAGGIMGATNAVTGSGFLDIFNRRGGP